MKDPLHVAVVGAASVAGGALLEILHDREFACASLHAVDGEHAAGSRLPLGNRDIAVEALAGFDFSGVQLAFFAAGAETAAAFVPKALAAGCIVIDTSAQFRGDAAAPLVVPELNPQVLAGGGKLLASPGAAAIGMLLALKPLHDAAGVLRVNAFCCHPVSEQGSAGVEELAQQTRALLNFQDLPRHVYPKQIAFNLLPQAAALPAGGAGAAEDSLQGEIRRVLGDDGILVNATSVCAPVFYGHSIALHIETARPLTAQQARELLATAPGLELLEEAEGEPTAVTEASGQDKVFAGRIRQDRSHPRGLNLWITVDNIRKGSALNAVQIAEALVRDYL